MKKQFLFASFLSLVVGCSSNGMTPLPEARLSARVMNAIDRGPVPADQMFDLVVGVRMRNADCRAARAQAARGSRRRAVAG